MHVVTTCTNISVYCEKKYTNYYIVSPYLVNNLYSMLVDFMLSLGGRVRQRNFSPVNGMVLESILITHAINYSGYECYFYHNMKNHSEVDLVLLNSDMSKVEVDTYLVEIKLSDKPEVAYAKGHWVFEQYAEYVRNFPGLSASQVNKFLKQIPTQRSTVRAYLHNDTVRKLYNEVMSLLANGKGRYILCYDKNADEIVLVEEY